MSSKIVIGGSRRISRLNSSVKRVLDHIMTQHYTVLVGDANGADKAVQRHLMNAGYSCVRVFCAEGKCRNNVGQWQVRSVVPRGSSGFHFYASKDLEMIEEADFGFMIWDGRSRGTLYNLLHLIAAGKKALLHSSPTRSFETLTTSDDLRAVLSRCEPEVITSLLRVVDSSLLPPLEHGGTSGVSASEPDASKQLVFEGLFQ